MSFTFPILLGGLALLAVPVLIHLILRQKPKTLKFPAFRFLLQKRKTNQRKLQLRHLLLLAFRMLILALICLALARPKLSGDLLELQTDRPVAIVMLFDTSFSMQYRTTGDRNRLDDARDKALALLDTLHADSRFIILDTAEAIVPAKAEWHKRGKAEEQIKALTLKAANNSVTTRLADAYQLFSKLAQDSTDVVGQRMPRVLCVFSDRTQASWEAKQVPHLQTLADAVPPPLERLLALQGGIGTKIALLKDLREKLPPAPAQDYPEQSLISHWEDLRQKIPSAHADNYPTPEWNKLLGQTRARSRDLLKLIRTKEPNELAAPVKDYRDRLLASLEDGLKELQGVAAIFVDVGVEDAIDLAIVTADLRSGNNGSAEARQVFSQKEKSQLQVMVQAFGSDIENTLNCQLGKRDLDPLFVAPKKGENKPLVFELGDDLPPGFHQIQLALSASDQLAFTNRGFVTFLVRPARKILMISDAPDGIEELKTYIEGNPKVHFQCSLQTPEVAENGGPQALASHNAVYLINVATPSDNLWQALKKFVEQGGNLAVVPGWDKMWKEKALAAYNSKEAQNLLPGKFIDKVADKDGAVWDWEEPTFFQHPFLRQFGNWKTLATPDFIQFKRRAYHYWEIEKNAGSAVLVHYATGKRHPALLERDFGKGRGRVLLLTTRLDISVKENWNNYLGPDSSWFVVFPGELSIYLAGDLETVKLNFLSGRGVPTVTLPPGNDDQSFLVRGPGPTESLPRPDQHNDLLIRNAVMPGNYVVEGTGKDGPVGAFSVNIPPEEGDLKRISPADLEDLFGKDTVRTLSQGDGLDEMLSGVFATPEELFPALMLALLVLLALENLLGNLFYRRRKEPEPKGASV